MDTITFQKFGRDPRYNQHHVYCDRTMVGSIRRLVHPVPAPRWTALLPISGRSMGRYASAGDAAAALVEHARQHPEAL